jgi:hypothetical protein
MEKDKENQKKLLIEIMEEDHKNGLYEIEERPGKNKNSVTIIDPPSGWQYGFPMPIPDERKNDVKSWLVEKGYPKPLIDSLGEHFYCRYWEEEQKSK